MARTRHHLAFALVLLSGCAYGPVVDRSGVRAAVALPGVSGVGVAYQVLRYRPAQGVAAFPDGGIPRYLDDRVVIALVTPAGGTRILQRLDNHGVHGSAGVGLRTSAADPAHLVATYSEQPSTSEPARMRAWRLDLASGARQALPDLARDLEARGRRLGSSEFGDFRVVAADGTLLIGAEAPEGPELWVWQPRQGYRRVDALKHFYGVAGDELYYWSGDEARVRNWRTGAYRVIARYDPQIRQTSTLLRRDPTVAAVERSQAPAPQVTWTDQAITIQDPGGPVRVIPLARDQLSGGR